MNEASKSKIEELTWKDVRVEVAKINSELAKIIDEIDPDREYTVFKASYPFGSAILKGGHFYLPNQSGDLVPLHSPEISASVQKKLGYNLGTNPVSMILKNTAEIFMILDDYTIPLYGLISPGKVMSTWRVLNKNSEAPAFLWDMTAGARSIFMLPKISETAGYNRIRKEFHLHMEKPKTYLNHWEIFRSISQDSKFGETWATEIIFFSEKWFTNLNDKKWKNFKLYLLERAWFGSEFFRNQFVWDLIFSLIQKQRNIKPSPYIVDTVKHLLAMGMGAFPGFVAAEDDSAGPIKRLQEIFTTIYRLNDYEPVVMHPYFLFDNDRPIYYSLEYPTTIEFSPRSRESATKIHDLYDVQSLLSKCLMDVRSKNLNLSGTSLYDLPKNVQYDFFHTEILNYSGIRLSSEIPLEDSTFMLRAKNASKKFPAVNAFMRGCIRIMHKKS